MLFGCEPARNIAASTLVLSVIEFGITPLVYPHDAYTLTTVLDKLYNIGMCLALVTLVGVSLTTTVRLQEKASTSEENEQILLANVGEGVLELTPEDKSIAFANEWASKFLDEHCYVKPRTLNSSKVENYTYRASGRKDDELLRYDLKRNVFFQTHPNSKNNHAESAENDDEKLITLEDIINEQIKNPH